MSLFIEEEGAPNPHKYVALCYEKAPQNLTGDIERLTYAEYIDDPIHFPLPVMAYQVDDSKSSSSTKSSEHCSRENMKSKRSDNSQIKHKCENDKIDKNFSKKRKNIRKMRK